MRRPYARRADRDTCQYRSKKAPGPGLRENGHRPRGPGKIRRSVLCLPVSLVRSLGFFAFSATLSRLEILLAYVRRQKARAGPHHSAVRPGLLEKENFTLARIAIEPASQEPKGFGKVGGCRRGEKSRFPAALERFQMLAQE